VGGRLAAKLKTDENLPKTAADLLRAAGHDVSTVLEQGLRGVTDSRVAAVCRSEGRALLTPDRGLGDIRAYPPADYPGIVVLRAGGQEIDRIIGLIRRLIALLETQSLGGTLWILDERRARIRR
jgi:predicted nuclease of predicted toxin-antitoxin system